MNKIQSAPTQRQDDGTAPVAYDISPIVRRVSLPDRVALRLGLALIMWSRRARRAPREPREYNPYEYRERAAARAAREERWARGMHSSLPWH